MPEAGEYLWDWYGDVSKRFVRVRDGVCLPIPPSEWLAWRDLTGNIVYSWEFDILHSMDVAFCDETNKEEMAKRAIDADRPPEAGRQRGRRR